MVPARGSTSHSTGVAPVRSMPATVGTQVFAWVITSSPGPTPSASSASSIASVPLATATACRLPAKPANSRSNARPSSPRTYQPLSSTLSTAASISARTASVARFRSANGIRIAPEGTLRPPMNLRAKLAALVQAALRRLGYELHPYPPPPRVEEADRRRDRLLRSRGITLLVDVGANVGEFGASVRASGFRGRIVSCEPLSGPYAELAERSATDPAWESRKLALGGRDGSAE